MHVERLESRAMLAINQPPVNHVPAEPQQAQIDLPFAFTDYRGNRVSISDPDAGENAVQVSLAVDSGTLTLLNPNPGGGITYASGTGTENASMQFTGTLASINTALSWVSFRPAAGFTGVATLTITTNDLGMVGTGGAKTDVDTISINVNPVPAFEPSPTYDTLPGVLDTSFDGTGKVVLSLTDGIDFIHDMKLMPDGKIVAVGALNNRFGIMRFNADMTLDDTFGTGGMTIADFGAGVHAKAFAVDAEGRIVVAGRDRVARLLSDGSVDQSFGGGGSVLVSYVGSAYAVALNPVGEILLLGNAEYSDGESSSRYRLMRLRSDGVVVATTQYRNGYQRNKGRGLFVRDDGDAILVGRGWEYNRQDLWAFAFHRVGANGVEEREFFFDTAGYPNTLYREVHSGLELPSGHVLTVGSVAGDLAISRQLPDGTPDASFGVDGMAVFPVLNAIDEGFRATLAADGKILVTGFANNGVNQDLFVARLTYDGQLETSFGVGGKVWVNFAGGNDYGYAIASLPDGKILAAGRAGNDIALVRLLGDFRLNTPPEDIQLSATAVADGTPAGTAVGTLSTTDLDAGDTFTYSLVAGAGSADNALFTIVGDELRTAVVIDADVKNLLRIRVRSTDASGSTVEKPFVVTVSNNGPGLTVIESEGSVTLARDEQWFLYANRTPILVGVDHLRLPPSSGSEWVAMAADRIGGTNSLVLRNSSGGLLRWSFDESWSKEPGGTWIPPGNPTFYQAEINFGVDFNGDAVVGPVLTAIESAGSVTLAYDEQGHLYANGTPLRFNGQFVRRPSGADPVWRFVAAETIAGVNTVMLRNRGNALYFWEMDAAWQQNRGYGWTRFGAVKTYLAEQEFGVDADSDGTIGPVLTPVESAGSVTLAYDGGAGHLWANGVPIVYRGTYVKHAASSNAVWRYLAADVDEGENTVVLKHSSGALWFWRLDASWTQQRGEKWTPANSPGFFAAEITFGVDFNENGEIGS